MKCNYFDNEVRTKGNSTSNLILVLKSRGYSPLLTTTYLTIVTIVIIIAVTTTTYLTIVIIVIIIAVTKPIAVTTSAITLTNSNLVL